MAEFLSALTSQLDYTCEMCEDVSVLCWLKKLRYNFEYYEPYDVYYFSLDDESLMEESIYGNVWQRGNGECRKSPELEVKFGEVCYISSEELRDQVDALDILPFPDCVHVDLEVLDEVMLWKNYIRSSYCEEEQNILENQVK